MRHKDENKKESITIAAIQLINEIGLAETSMSKIAKRAGVSSATIYVYFLNKNDMIKNLYLTIKKDMQQKIFNGIDISAPVKAEYESVLRKYVNYFLKNKDYFLFFEQYVNSPLIQDLGSEEAENLVKPFLDFIENAKKQKIFIDVDDYLIFVYSFSPLIQIAKQYFNENFPLNEDIVEQAIKMSWEAIKK